MHVVSLTTDFGDSPYVGQLKGTLLRLYSSFVIVDNTHSVPPQNIVAGAIALADSVPHFPVASIHIAVVDPGVGTTRPLVAARMDDWWVIGPDNGLLSELAWRSRFVQAVVLNRPEYWSPDSSRTFHGRDIMAHVAAHLAQGVPLHQLGEGTRDLHPNPIPIPEKGERTLVGQTLFADSYGNLITNLTAKNLETCIESPGKVFLPDLDRHADWVTTYGEARPGEVVSLIGSSGRIELSIVNGSAAKVFQPTGTKVEIRW